MIFFAIFCDFCDFLRFFVIVEIFVIFLRFFANYFDWLIGRERGKGTRKVSFACEEIKSFRSF